MVGYLDDHSSDMYQMYDPVMNTVRNMWDVHLAVWIHTDPTETMQIFANGTTPTEMTGALDEDQLPVMTMTTEDDDNDDSNDKVGRNVNDDDGTTEDGTAIPAWRNAMEDGMAAMSATLASTITMSEPPSVYSFMTSQ